jgi:Zn-dependent peptidase ImmA (M78 family)/transcriptional regulator with XRE-family HTH domain
VSHTGATIYKILDWHVLAVKRPVDYEELDKDMTTQVAGIQPAVLRWARESQGYSVEDVAFHLRREVNEVIAWEAGKTAPTYAQLEKLAYTLYKRPLAVFFMPVPPLETKVKQEFRTLPEFDLDQLTADTRYQLRLARAHQVALRELNGGVNPAQRKIFRDIQFSSHTQVPQAAAAMRQYFGVTIEDQATWKTTEEALKAWRNKVEDAGVFVFKHSFKQKAISGFCLSDDEFPVIYLNNSSPKTRQIFSLFHELAHLLLKVNAITKFDLSYIEQLPNKEKRIEQFCNALAAEFLMPTTNFNKQLTTLDDYKDQAIQTLARRYHVSREAILRRILDRGLVTQVYYETKAKQWEEAEHGGSGGDYYATQSTYLGERYLQLVFSKHYQGSLTLEQVADYLGVRSKSVAGIEAIMLRKAIAA